MPRMTLDAAVTEDRESAVIHLREDGKALGHIILDATALDAVIYDLAKVRAALSEEVTPTLDPFSRVEIVEKPAWRIPDRHSGPPDTTLLALRHPGLGWLGFLLERDRALKIAKGLADYPNPPSPDTSSDSA